MNLSSAFRRAAHLARRLGGTQLAKPSIYKIGDYAIGLPAGHPLPDYQAAFRLYDRFPCVIGKNAFDGWLVDIGANIGDTAAAFCSGPPKKVLCIEPLDEFHAQLEANLSTLRSRGSVVRVLKDAVGHGETITLSASNGTARSATSGTRFTLRSLDEIIGTELPDQRIGLIKSDVDGFDANALLSGVKVLERERPLLLFECDLRSAADIDPYVRLLKLLSGLDYEVCVLDNFGAPLHWRISPCLVEDIFHYVVSMAQGAAARTFYYVDCFAWPRSSAQAEAIKSEYARVVSGAA